MVREGASSCCVSVKCRAVVMEGVRKGVREVVVESVGQLWWWRVQAMLLGGGGGREI